MLGVRSLGGGGAVVGQQRPGSPVGNLKCCRNLPHYRDLCDAETVRALGIALGLVRGL